MKTRGIGGLIPLWNIRWECRTYALCGKKNLALGGQDGISMGLTVL